jgi:excisionase family DNA binding protein
MSEERISERKYSIREASELLHVSAITVWRELHRGNLGSYAIGARRLIGESHLAAYLAARECPASKAA